MFYYFFNKSSSGVGAIMRTDTANRVNITLNQQLVDELHVAINKKFSKCQVH